MTGGHQQVGHLTGEVPLESHHLTRRGRIAGEETLAQACCPEREAPEPDRLPLVHEHELDASAADVDQQMGPAREPERVVGGAEDETRLLGPRDDSHGNAGLAPEPSHEGGAVGRFAHRAGGDRAHALHPARAGEARERLHRLHGELHRVGIEATGRDGVPAETDHLLHAIDDLDPSVGAQVGDHHVDRVRSDVDRRETHGGA